ncbi:exoribonuclease [Lipomyces oligophaga]|uniref:exoribonuclease n=1 Tax=Lipomyces oligophaga TaxID=45792 RepID=UPI0034CD7657
MGIPKFFRWMSERYPLISQLVEDNKIPEFDNMYLDMNGILHNCTHGDSGDTTFRLTEEKMFSAIFTYIELIVDKIKPQKVLFMAVDGVAPRAKMNNQRSRRFRSAMDAESARGKAMREGKEMPSEPPFDSNAITPGTEFMAKLSKQLDYFITRKVSTDSHWASIQVILSGHEVPGEGEHKIMEYIRKTKSEPGYFPNTRHCFYGLDADLIMLGLVSHEPHFALLREEVTFGRKEQKKDLFHQNFFLLHLSLVREYLELEFASLQFGLSFPYDFERILDDFILLCIFVGNDFLPNLPQFHINENALTFMFESYKKMLPQCSGYITDSGTIDFENLRILMKAFMDFEFKLFENSNDDSLYSGSKITENGRRPKMTSKRGIPLSMTTQQNLIFKSLEKYVSSASTGEKWELPKRLIESDLPFVDTLAAKLSLSLTISDDPDPLISLSIPANSDSDSTDEEAEAAIERVLAEYRSATVSDGSSNVDQKKPSSTVLDKFNNWKDTYYKEKVGFSFFDEPKLKEMCENYIEGIQWVLNYYYKGVCSWGWFYRYHYSPRISDVSKGLGININFDLGQPFYPFQQLMAVLPDLSNKLVPYPYRSLMHDPSSPIIDFYPATFDLDMNGKKMEWEAVVKIPFVDQSRLLKALKALDKDLTKEEKERNSFGDMTIFSFDPSIDKVFKSSLEGVFPDIEHSHCGYSTFHFPSHGREFQSKLCEGAFVGANMLSGFPTLKTVPFSSFLSTKHSVQVFDQESKREAMLITIENPYDDWKTEQVAQKFINMTVYVGYPFLTEALVVGASDSKQTFKLDPGSGKIIQEESDFKSVMDSYNKEFRYYSRHGVDIGLASIAMIVRPFSGMTLNSDGALIKQFESDFEKTALYSLQTTVASVVHPDQRFVEKAAPKIDERYPIGTRAFFLGKEAFGKPAVVKKINDARHLEVFVAGGDSSEGTNFGTHFANVESQHLKYYSAMDLCREFKIPALLLSKMTSSFMVTVGTKSLNIGLNLKFEGKKQKVLGYSTRTDRGWSYSDKAKELFKEYMKTFPTLIRGLTANLHTDRPELSKLISTEDVSATSEKLKEWLKSKTVGMERVGLDTEQLLPETVAQIEAEVDKRMISDKHAAPRLISKVPLKLLLKPAEAIHQLSKQKFSLGDRAVYVRDSGTVPIGSVGTVVGISVANGKTVLEMFFDKSFMGGTTLGGRCSDSRGMTVESSAVINLTNRQIGPSPIKAVGGHGINGGLTNGHGGSRGVGSVRGGTNRGGFSRGGMGRGGYARGGMKM